MLIAPELTGKMLNVLETLSWLRKNIVYPGKIQNALDALNQIAEMLESLR